MTRREILGTAAAIVTQEEQYGKAEDNFETIRLLWSVYLRSAHPKLRQVMAINGITPQDVAIMMSLLKIARIATGQPKADNFVDLAGYAACAGAIAMGGGSHD